MVTVEQELPELVRGDYMSRAEFLRRWEAMPHVKRAELIRGVVYMPSPLSRNYGKRDRHISTWLGVYEAATPGCEGFVNNTWFMGGEETPQPDNSLRVLPQCGGQSTDEGIYARGAPEFLAETCLSSTSFDLNQKLEVYEEAGVQEYLAVLLREREVRWHRLAEGHFEVVPPPADSVYRSAVFPGLWLDAAALLAGDLARVLAVLQQGIDTAEHRALVEELARRKANRAGT
jgi:putative restriction endonuclease